MKRVESVTPGPWRFVNEHNGDSDLIVGTTGEVVVRPIGSWGCSPADPKSHGLRVKPTDRRLITRAPKLLEAVKRLLEADPGGEVTSEFCRASDACQKLVDAIEKGED